MDVLISLLLMVMLYIVPKLWRRFILREYTYSEVPNQVIPSEMEFVTEESIGAVTYRSDKVQSPVVHHEGSILPPTEEQGAWEGKINNNLIVNGVIFAEILQPPRAYRPFKRRLK